MVWEGSEGVGCEASEGEGGEAAGGVVWEGAGGVVGEESGEGVVVGAEDRVCEGWERVGVSVC